MILYLSGPMTGYRAYNAPAFHAAAERLQARGHVVLNPGALPPGLSDEAYMDIDLAMVRACEGVALLPGWERSAGARAEACYARRIGRPTEHVRELLRDEWTVELAAALRGVRCTRGEERTA